MEVCNVAKILLVEDDKSLAIGLMYTFKEEGFECLCAQTAKSAREIFDSSYDIVVMDVELPDGNGYDLCREIRSKSDVPIIFLTSYDDEVNIVMGLDMGGDDYVTKPFQLKVLMSRIKANIRRRNPVRSNIIKVGDLKVNTELCVAYVSDAKLELTATELRLITLFITNVNKTLTRTVILERLWDNQGKFIDDNTISVHIRHIREKLRGFNSDATIITIRGIGYRMEV
jgi:DNA-binding response OmpR family regulator